MNVEFNARKVPADASVRDYRGRPDPGRPRDRGPGDLISIRRARF